MALMELIQHHGSHALEVWIGKQSPCQYALGDKPQASARPHGFFKPDLVADSLAGLFAHLPRDSARRHACRNPARFQYNHFTAHDPKQRGRHSGRLPRARRGLDHQVRIPIKESRISGRIASIGRESLRLSTSHRNTRF